MIGLLDPAFFLPRASQAEEQTLVAEIDLLVRTCRLHGIAVPPFDEYWPDL